MKALLITSFSALCLVMAGILSTLPPQSGYSQPAVRLADTVVALPAIILDTAGLDVINSRLNKKAEHLGEKMKEVNNTAAAVEKESRRLERVSRHASKRHEKDPVAPLAGTYASQGENGPKCQLSCAEMTALDSMRKEPKRNFIQRLKYLVRPKHK